MFLGARDANIADKISEWWHNHQKENRELESESQADNGENGDDHLPSESAFMVDFHPQQHKENPEGSKDTTERLSVHESQAETDKNGSMPE